MEQEAEGGWQGRDLIVAQVQKLQVGNMKTQLLGNLLYDRNELIYGSYYVEIWREREKEKLTLIL